jgi:hypothetical protein
MAMQMYHRLRVQHPTCDRRILVGLVRSWYVAQRKTHGSEDDLVALWIIAHPQTKLSKDETFPANLMDRFSPEEHAILGGQLWVAN